MGKCSSASSSSSSHSSILVRWWAIVFSSGKFCPILGWGMSVSSEDSSSSSNVKWQCTVLREPGGGCALGVAGLKDKFSCVETWYSHGALCRGVGIFTLSIPLSYPSSSCAYSHSNTLFKVVTKQPKILHQVMCVLAVRNCCRKMPCKLFLWWHWVCLVWDLPSKIVRLILCYSI